MGEAEPTIQTSVEKIYKISTTDHIVQFIQSKCDVDDKMFLIIGRLNSENFGKF